MSTELTTAYQRFDAVRAQPVIAARLDSLNKLGIVSLKQQEAHHQQMENVVMAGFTGIATRVDAGFSQVSNRLDAGFSEVSNRLDAGYSQVSNRLDSGFSEVSSQIGAMSAGMNLGFSRLTNAVVESSRAICDQLDKINDKLDNPSRQKSQEAYRRALKAHADGQYETALKLALEAAEEYKIDPLSWFLAGELYRSGRTVSATGKTIDVTNPDEAVKMFEEAADLITPDAKKQPEARPLAAEIWFYLGVAYLVKAGKTDGKLLGQAQKALENSWSYSPEMLEAKYNLARSKIFLGDAPGALRDLEAVILKDRWYSVKTAADPDFDPIREEFRALIDRMRRELYPSAKPVYDEIQILKARLQQPPFAELAPLLEALPDSFTEDMPYFDMREATDDNLLPRIRELLQYQLEREQQYPQLEAEFDEIQVLKSRVRTVPERLQKLIKDLPNRFPGFAEFISSYKSSYKALELKSAVVGSSLEVGQIYKGVVREIVDIPPSGRVGHVEIFPGKTESPWYDIPFEVWEGQEIPVKLMQIQEETTSGSSFKFSFIDVMHDAMPPLGRLLHETKYLLQNWLDVEAQEAEGLKRAEEQQKQREEEERKRQAEEQRKAAMAATAKLTTKIIIIVAIIGGCAIGGGIIKIQGQGLMSLLVGGVIGVIIVIGLLFGAAGCAAIGGISFLILCILTKQSIFPSIIGTVTCVIIGLIVGALLGFIGRVTTLRD